MPFRLATILLAVVLLTAWPTLAFAYIDPGTGSALIQGLIAAIAAIGVTLFPTRTLHSIAVRSRCCS